MALIEFKPEQESTSTYFNSIVRHNVTPLTVNDLPEQVLADFNEQVRLAFTDEADQTIRRVRYLVPYILQSIDWDEYGIPLEAWQLRYYYRRDRFLQKTELTYEAFMAHEPMQQALAALGLDPEPTFEFILFLKYYYGLRSELRYSPLEQLQQAGRALEGAEEASLDINVGGKHFKISNAAFIREALKTIDHEALQATRFVNDFNEGPARDKIRALDYFIIRTLLDYLPIRRPAVRIGMFTQDERNLGLSVLSVLGRLPDVEREFECGKYNNATFDKLMRDFQATPIPFAMELFL